VRLRSTASRLEASRHPRQPTANDPTREELAERVGKIASPMQIIVGENDWLAAAAQHLHELLPASKLAVIPGAPHNVYWAAADAYNAELQRDLAGTVWSTGGCRSWYMDEHGVNRTLWSGMTWQYWLATRRFKASEYKFIGAGSTN